MKKIILKFVSNILIFTLIISNIPILSVFASNNSSYLLDIIKEAMGDASSDNPAGNWNEAIYGNAGSDVLDGGTGNDILCGGNGTDTYIFAKDYGQDTINEWGSDLSNVLLTDINSDEITVSDQWGSNLLISVNDTDDVLIISNFKWGQATYTFKFADGAEGYVDKDNWQLVLTKQPDIIEEEIEETIEDSLQDDDNEASEVEISETEEETLIDETTSYNTSNNNLDMTENIEDDIAA